MNDTLSLRKRLGLEIARKLTDLTIAEHPLRHLFWECTLRWSHWDSPAATVRTLQRNT